VGSLEVVILQEAVEVTLNLGGFEIPGGPPGDPEALVEEPTKPLVRAEPIRGPTLAAIHRQEQLEGMLIGPAGHGRPGDRTPSPASSTGRPSRRTPIRAVRILV
jgi:hypothetical protein